MSAKIVIAAMGLGLVCLGLFFARARWHAAHPPPVAVRPQPSQPPLAQVTQLQGEVQIRAVDGQTQPAVLGAALAQQEVISTGANSQAEIRFADGTTLHLKPNSSLALGPVGSTLTELGVILLRGELTASGQPRQKPLQIKTPLGLTQLSTQLSEVVISVTKGVRVVTGAITLLDNTGQPTTVHAGEAMHVAGLVVAVDTTLPEPSSLLHYRLRVAPSAPLGSVQLQKSAALGWQTSRGVTRLQSGDQVRSNSTKASASLLFAPSGQLQWQGVAHFVLASHAATEKTVAAPYAADYRLQSSQQGFYAKLILPQRDDNLPHRLQLGETLLQIHPTWQAADLEIRQLAVHASGVPIYTLELRFGQLRLSTLDSPATLLVEAGSKIVLRAGSAAQVMPLSAHSVQVYDNCDTTVYYDVHQPAVNFTWAPRGRSSTNVVQLALDAQFQHLVAQEQSSHGALMLDRLTQPHYYWRRRAAAPPHHLWLRADRAAHCAACDYQNVVRSSSDTTTIYYQQKLPRLSFAWAGLAAAKFYDLQIFKDGQFEQALYRRKTSQPRLSSDATTLPEGHYFWRVQPLNAQGQRLNVDRLRALHVLYDNALENLHIRAPLRQTSLPHRRAPWQVAAMGEAKLGMQVSLNGSALDLDARGHFSQKVLLPAVPGVQNMVFRSRDPNGQESVYVRELVVR